ncbi:MAG: hypothetical protein GY821_09545 [Gammaproteobacteria bacterium]|nr:hypothetical protein [Gammaproteobacteria bacterium]
MPIAKILGTKRNKGFHYVIDKAHIKEEILCFLFALEEDVDPKNNQSFWQHIFPNYATQDLSDSGFPHHMRRIKILLASKYYKKEDAPASKHFKYHALSFAELSHATDYLFPLLCELIEQMDDDANSLVFTKCQGWPVLMLNGCIVSKDGYAQHLMCKPGIPIVKGLSKGIYVYKDDKNNVWALVVHSKDGYPKEEHINLSKHAEYQLLRKIPWRNVNDEEKCTEVALSNKLLQIITSNCKHDPENSLLNALFNKNNNHLFKKLISKIHKADRLSHFLAIKDDSGENIFCKLAKGGYFYQIEYLTKLLTPEEYTALLNSPDNQGYTVLMTLVDHYDKRSDFKMLSWLLAHIPDKHRETLLEYRNNIDTGRFGYDFSTVNLIEELNNKMNKDQYLYLKQLFDSDGPNKSEFCSTLFEVDEDKEDIGNFNRNESALCPQ